MVTLELPATEMASAFDEVFTMVHVVPLFKDWYNVNLLVTVVGL